MNFGQNCKKTSQISEKWTSDAEKTLFKITVDGSWTDKPVPKVLLVLGERLINLSDNSMEHLLASDHSNFDFYLGVLSAHEGQVVYCGTYPNMDAANRLIQPLSYLMILVSSLRMSLATLIVLALAWKPF